MSIDGLKMILETVQGVSDSAVWVVILYFGVGVLKTGVWASVLIILFKGSFACLKYGIDSSGSDDKVRQVVKAAGKYLPIDDYSWNKILITLEKARKDGSLNWY